jgi:hypothetical protein
MWNGSVYSGLQFEEGEESAYHVGTYAGSQIYLQGVEPTSFTQYHATYTVESIWLNIKNKNFP